MVDANQYHNLGDNMNANELADAMEIRASIRRQATSRKSVQENANDRLADQLDQAATMLRQQQAEIEALKDIVKRFTDEWTDKFKNYEYNSDEPEENKLRDDVFAILRKAQE